MRYDEETEERIEDLDEDQLRSLMDRIMRAAADRGYFGDDVAMSEIDRLIRGTKSTRTDDRLFKDEIVGGRRRFRYPRGTPVRATSELTQRQIRSRLEDAVKEANLDEDFRLSISREEFDELVQDGMDSRIGDLEDTIDISPFIRETKYSEKIVEIEYQDVNNRDPEVKQGLEEEYDVEVSYRKNYMVLRGQRENIQRFIDREFDNYDSYEKKQEFPDAYR